MPNSIRSPFQKRTGIFLLLAFISGIFLTFLLLHFRPATIPTPGCSYNMTRLKGYEHIQPLLSVDRDNEAKRYIPLKNDLQGLIDSLKSAGDASEVAVFFQEFSQGRWTAVGGERRFHPASLMKVALLLGYLRMAEATPSLLTQKWKYEKPASQEVTPQFYHAPTIEPGKEYTVHELLYFMMAHSDNHATWLLSSRYDVSHLKKLFAELGLQEPTEDELQFTLSPREYALFFKAIYNGAYLSLEYSEYAANLMSHSSFGEGFAKGFPLNTKMWRKFGEWRSPGQDFELHESGIIYFYGKPYHLTVMTKGKDTEKLAGAIRLVCGRVYKGAVAADNLPLAESPTL